MKKFLSLLVLFALMLTVTSCATSKKEDAQATNNFDFYNGIWASDQYELLGATCIDFYEINNDSGKSWFWNDSDGGKSYENSDTIILTFTDGELYLVNKTGEKAQQFKVIDDNTLAMCGASSNYSLEGSMYFHKIESTDEYIASLPLKSSLTGVSDSFFNSAIKLLSYFEVNDPNYENIAASISNGYKEGTPYKYTVNEGMNRNWEEYVIKNQEFYDALYSFDSLKSTTTTAQERTFLYYVEGYWLIRSDLAFGDIYYKQEDWQTPVIDYNPLIRQYSLVSDNWKSGWNFKDDQEEILTFFTKEIDDLLKEYRQVLVNSTNVEQLKDWDVLIELSDLTEAFLKS